MLRLIEGGFSAGLFDEIKKQISLSCKRGRRVYLIVPEQQTVIAEAEMTDFMPADAPLYFEVTNFTRLANSAFRALGGVAGEYCDKTKKTLIMWRALTELAPLLNATASMREIPASLAQKYLSAVSEAQNAGISADKLTELALSNDTSFDARLRGKLSDLGAVMSLYKKLLAERYSDTADDIGNLIKKLSEHRDFLTDTDIYIDGFTSFTEGQLRLIGKLSARTDITIALILPKSASGAFEFGECADTHSHLVSSAAREGVEVKLIRIDGRFGKRYELLHEATDKIWRSGDKFDNYDLQNPDVIRIFATKTPFDMCDFICADIRRKVSLNARFSDFAIVCARSDAYSGILDMALKKYAVPAFASYKRRADEFSLIRLILSAYKAIMSSFSREDIISYAKCGFLNVSAEDVDLFEIYVSSWRIDKRRFTDGMFWGMSPYGYDKKRTDKEDEILERIDRAKKAIIDPLIAFKESADGCTTVKEHTTALVDFLATIDAEVALLEKASKLECDGELAEGEEYSRLWGTLCTALDGLVEALGDMEASTESFLTLLKIAISGVEIGRIPSYADEVTVGCADMLRLYGKKHIYLIGVNEGEFPSSVSAEGGYFAERERGLLALAGVELDTDAEIKNARELFCFSRAMSYAEESLTLIYCEVTSAMKPSAPSDAIERLTALSGGKIKIQKAYEMSASELIWTPESAQDNLGALSAKGYESLKGALREIEADKAISIAESPITNNDITLTRELAESFYGDELWLSQTKIDSYADCPMKHFCRFNLELSDNEIYEFGAKNIGIFVHAVLEGFFRALKKSGGSVNELDAPARDKMIESAAKEYLGTLTDSASENGEKMNIRISRLVRAARPIVEKLCDEVKNSRYLPTFFELRLSDKSPSLPDVPSFRCDADKTIKVAGVVDRVDTMRAGEDVYVRVIDYKTGSKLFSPEDIKKGRNLQMFIYLKAIYDTKSDEFKEKLGVQSGGKILPAGVMYIGTSVNDVTVKGYDEDSAIEAVKSKQRCQGMLLDDPASIDGMDKSFTPLKYTKGEISEGSKQLLYSADGWADIMQNVESSIVKTAEEMRSGRIAPNPEKSDGKNPCEYCEFKPICRRNNY